ncbi:MAG TPA: HD domain-containing phosphohydrolase [Gemmatimonadaceae bacterium]|nr:HD domain-containing phosphohydrolase [Gemmatimonadaceae bacterium]
MRSRTQQLDTITLLERPARPPRLSAELTQPRRISLSEVLSALSCALDLTEGAPAGHTMRSCLIGMRIAESIGIGAADRSALYYALLLKDAGCSSNAGRMASLFGADDLEVKPRMKLVNWHKRLTLAIETARTVGRGRPLGERLRNFVALARARHTTKELIQIRCDRGASIASQLGFPPETAEAIRSLDEHWCGLGYARGLAGGDIPLLARIANLAQTVEAFHDRGGVEEAHRVVRERSGTWFDPVLSRIVLGWRPNDPWWELLRGDVTGAVVAAEPSDRVIEVDEDGLDGVSRAFADIIDAKSPFTYRHSTRVAEVARLVAARCGLDDAEQRRIYRAGLLHDIGKLGVSNLILDKNGPLTPAERERVEQHPRYSLEILQRVSAFSGFALTAALHHEKLDGSGYPWGVDAKGLDLPARILVVSDMYDALSSDRPYRKGMDDATITSILERERGTKLCPVALDALHAVRAELARESSPDVNHLPARIV